MLDKLHSSCQFIDMNVCTTKRFEVVGFGLKGYGNVLKDLRWILLKVLCLIGLNGITTKSVPA